MKWYQDQAYISWQRRDGTVSKYLDRAIRYAKKEGDKQVKNDVASAAVQLNSEYAVWTASMVVERQRVLLYTQSIAQISMSVECDFEEAERLRATAGVATRIFNEIQAGKHWKNVWKETPSSDDA